MDIQFDNLELFKNLVAKNGLNLFLGAGFSTYARNKDGEPLPLGDTIKDYLIENFDLNKNRNYTLDSVCQKIKQDKADLLKHLLKEKYEVDDFDKEYYYLDNLPIKNIVTTNIDNLIENIFNNKDTVSNISDICINGPLEREHVINFYKLHGSVTYPFDKELTFSISELRRAFMRNPQLYRTVASKLISKPTIYWGTRLTDNDIINMLIESEENSKTQPPKWIVIYPGKNYEEYVEDFRYLGFNIIVADTKKLLQFLNSLEFTSSKEEKPSNKRNYTKFFPLNYITDKLLKNTLSRPVSEFLSGAEPMLCDILSENVNRTSYYNIVLDKIFSLSSNKTILITGIPGCGKSTLLMQLAASDDITVPKFWFKDMLKTEAEKLVKIVEKEKLVYIFLDNLYSNIDSFDVLKQCKNIRLIVAERSLNYEYAKKHIDISLNQIVDISNLKLDDIKAICVSLKRSDRDVSKIIAKNRNVSLLEIVFYVYLSTELDSRIKRYINDLESFKEKSADADLRIDLLELFTLVNYTSACGVPITMDMLFGYFKDEINNYDDIYYALGKMNKVIVDDDESMNISDQDCLVVRSRIFAEKSLKFLPREVFAKILMNFVERISPFAICRYDIFRKRGYDADFTKKAFSLEDGVKYYQTVLKQNSSPYVKQQYAIYLLRIREIGKAWSVIDEAYTESKHKIFSIANTHALIMFEKNILVEINKPEEIAKQKTIIEQSFSTLEYCMDTDIRAAYHVYVYAKNTLRYYDKFGADAYFVRYKAKAQEQIGDILGSNTYTYNKLKSGLIKFNRSLSEIY